MELVSKVFLTVHIFCELVISTTPSVCHLPKDTGPCDGICPRWFFTSHTRTCAEFYYGCCGGNANNFKTEQECLNACNNGCPNGQHNLFCKAPACQVTSCQNYPTANCTEVCNGCVAIFTVHGKDVTNMCSALG
ncbi:tabkunin 2-like [Ostrea edulis]|uniref:tabkunin 2-like n=1 Tax=Ostrea edulis TaxID=37623 RepID=UPI0024AEA28C|nr:tabkunin 2-like [Ostrea edulis]